MRTDGAALQDAVLFQGGLEKDDLGLIMVKDDCAYAAVKRDKIKDVIRKTKDEKLKGIKVILELAR